MLVSTKSQYFSPSFGGELGEQQSPRRSHPIRVVSLVGGFALHRQEGPPFLPAYTSSDTTRD